MHFHVGPDSSRESDSGGSEGRDWGVGKPAQT